MANIQIRKNCPICNHEHSVTVDEEKWKKYQNGEGNIQNIFSELSAAEREILITGICGKCWDNVVVPIKDEFEL